MRRTIRGRGARGFVEPTYLVAVDRDSLLERIALGGNIGLLLFAREAIAPITIDVPSPLLCMRGSR